MHLDVPTTAQITALLDDRHPASVSIYLPAGRSTLDAQTARTMLSNIRRDVSEQFEASGVDADDRSASRSRVLGRTLRAPQAECWGRRWTV